MTEASYPGLIPMALGDHVDTPLFYQIHHEWSMEDTVVYGDLELEQKGADSMVVAAPAQGIDVARYQGTPDWNKVANAGIKYAYVKSSDGSSATYTSTDSQYAGANNAGLVTGLYHYARPTMTPEVNADALAYQVNRLGAVYGHLPPCLDLEEGTGDQSSWAKAFIARLRSRTGCRRVMIYSGASFFKTNIGESWMDTDTALWIAHYGRTPGQPGYLTDRVAIHQYSATGSVNGITGNVDLDQTIWSLDQIVTPLSGSVVPTTAVAATTSEETETVNLSVSTTLPAGQGMQVPVLVPPYVGKSAVFRLATGWTDATIRAVYFIRDAGPNMTPQQEQWGGTGPFVLAHDDRPWWVLPEGTTQISIDYDCAHPIGAMITYAPASTL